MDLHYNFPNREEIEVLKESKLLSQVIWSGSTFHTLTALDEKVFCPEPVLTLIRLEVWGEGAIRLPLLFFFG